MTNKARILGIQIQPEIGNKQINLDKARKLIEENAWYKPDLIVLPEVFTSGVDHKALHKCAENIPEGETTQFFSELAKKYSTNIVAGSFVERCDAESEVCDYKNTSVVLTAKVKLLGNIRKSICLTTTAATRENMFLQETGLLWLKQISGKLV